MEQTNQDKLREALLRRCMKQTEIADENKISNVYFNAFLKGKRDIGKKLVKRLWAWLED